MASFDQVDLPKEYFSLQKLLLKCIGLSLTPNRGVIYKTYSISLLTLLVSFPFLVFWDIFTGLLDFNNFVNNILYGVGIMIVVTKQLVILIKRSRLRNIMDTFEHGAFLSDFQYREQAETIRITNCVKFTRKISIVGAVMGLYTIGFAVVAAFVTDNGEDDRLLPFGTMSILTENMSYEIVFAYQTVVLLASVTVYVMVDIIYGGLILHICIQLRILENFIKKMSTISYTGVAERENLNTKIEEYSKIPWEYLKEMVKNAVLYHIAILKISKETEEVFNITVLTESVAMSVSCCLLLYHASTLSVTNFYFQKDIVVLICGSSTMFLMSYLGNEVIIRSQAIASACYEGNFIGIDIRFQKALILITQRSQRPITFTVGKFATLSLVTAISVCRACYSYYMLLHRINEK